MRVRAVNSRVLPVHDRRIGAPVVTFGECGEVAVERSDPVRIVGNTSVSGRWLDRSGS